MDTQKNKEPVKGSLQVSLVIELPLIFHGIQIVPLYSIIGKGVDRITDIDDALDIFLAVIPLNPCVGDFLITEMG